MQIREFYAISLQGCFFFFLKSNLGVCREILGPLE